VFVGFSCVGREYVQDIQIFAGFSYSVNYLSRDLCSHSSKGAEVGHPAHAPVGHADTLKGLSFIVNMLCCDFCHVIDSNGFSGSGFSVTSLISFDFLEKGLIFTSLILLGVPMILLVASWAVRQREIPFQQQ
jgi:hypothetical protein